MNRGGDRNYQRDIRFEHGTNEYQVRVPRKRNWKWLWLLLLLLLFVRCERTIVVTTVDAETNAPVEDVKVALDYTAHYLYKHGFFTKEAIAREQQTDSVGKAVFEKLPCSVFSYIFYTLSKVNISAKSPCYEDAQAKRLFHWCWNQNFKLKRRLIDLYVKVVDKETSEPLVDATVELTYNTTGEMVTDTIKTDANGQVFIPQFWECALISQLKGSCYGYADTIKTDVPARDLREIGPASTLKLRPLKESFEFFVHNVETREPIPMASATVTLTNPDKKTTRGTTKTNVDGKGRGYYDDGFILATIGIEASKIHYYDSILVGTYTVEQFIKLPREKRTVWLRPKPYMVKFENVDSITGEPIVGVTNKITVTDPTGKVEIYEEISNTNGKFSLLAKEGSKVEIISIKEEEYETKHTVIDSFKEGEKIPMVPIMVKCAVDIVFCIDNTSSMSTSLDMVKRNAMSFHKDLKDCAEKHKRKVENMRLKVIAFGDLLEAPLYSSDMYSMPDEQDKFNSYMMSMPVTGGGDIPENGLETLATAIKDTPWNSDPGRKRNIIILYTDAPAKPLNLLAFVPYLPADMPTSMDELTDLWNTMDPVARRLVLVTPDSPNWNYIYSNWDGVFHKDFSPYIKYDDILEAICKSM